MTDTDAEMLERARTQKTTADKKEADRRAVEPDMVRDWAKSVSKPVKKK